MKKLVMFLMAGLMLACSAQAAISVANPSFEAVSIPTKSYVNGPPADWTWDNLGVGTSYILDTGYANNFWTVDIPDGENYHNHRRDGVLSQDIGTVDAATDYTLTVALGNSSDSANQLRECENYELRFLLDGTQVATTGIIDGQTITSTNPSAPGDGWEDFSLDWTSGAAGGTLSIELRHTAYDTGSSDGRAGYFDNVRVVPEPATMALLSLGSFVMIRRKRA